MLPIKRKKQNSSGKINIKWLLPVLMILIILPGLHYTGFVTFFKSPSLNDLNPPENNNAGWTPLPSSELSLQNLEKGWEGNDFSLETLKGKLVLLNFWASWCLPCVKEFPELLEAVKWGKGRLSLVAVSVDSDKKDMEKFLKEQTLSKKGQENIHIVWDPQSQIARQFNVAKFPETFVLDKNLKIAKKFTGLFLLEKAKPDLIKLLPAK